MLGAAAPGLLVASSEHLLEPPTAVLAACAVVSVLYASKWGEGAIQISAAFVCFMLAVAFVGAVGAAAIAVLAELGAWAIQRYRLVALPVNIAATAVPSSTAAASARRCITRARSCRHWG
jgi:hypothetical protein